MTTHPWITPEIPIDSIVVGERHRKEPGDIKGLAESIDDIGLIHPIVVTPDHRLIAGQRRLLALKRLGWDSVPVNIIHTLNGAVDELMAERDENLCRKPMTASELATLAEALEPLEREEAVQRREAGGRFGSTVAKAQRDGSPLPPGDGKGPKTRREREEGSTDYQVGQALGVSATTYRRIRDVHRTATGQTDAPPEVVELAQDLLAKTDRGEIAINAAHQALKKREAVTHVGRGNEKRQLRALEGVRPQLSAVATALEVAFGDGFEKTCTRAIAAEYVKMFETDLSRIKKIVSRLKEYGKEV